MGREINRLSAVKISKTTKPGRYADGGGLWLQVATSGTKSWLFRYTRHGKARHAGLGPLNTVSLADARAKALQARRMLLEGIDPLEEKQSRRTAAKAQAASAVTFKQAAERYISAFRSSFKNAKHREQWPNSLKAYVYPQFGDVAVSKIETSHVIQALQPIWAAKTETASRIRGRIEAVLDWAKVQGMRKGENPARWKGHLDKLLPPRTKVAKVQHHAAMPYDRLPAFMEALRAMNCLSARALEFTILNACRTGETIGAQWSEIDLANAVWIIPAERTKSDREHRIPLSNRAVEILKALPRIRDETFVFPGSRQGASLSNMAMLELVRGIPSASNYTVHGFRSSYRDFCGEKTNFAREVIEQSLAHRLKDRAEAAYARGDLLLKRRALMDTWAAFCSSSAPKNSRRFRPVIRRLKLRNTQLASDI